MIDAMAKEHLRKAAERAMLRAEQSEREQVQVRLERDVLCDVLGRLLALYDQGDSDCAREFAALADEAMVLVDEVKRGTR